MLYERHNYLNKDISFFIGRELIEYDISSAGFNIIKRYGLLNSSIVERLEKLDKVQRQKHIGLLMRRDHTLASNLNEKFIEIRKEFFEANYLYEDDILSIKKDAVFTFKRCYNAIFDNVEFVEKNTYSSYFYINRKEIYYNSFKNIISVKGISDDDLELHTDYMLAFLSKMLKMLETSSKDNTIKMLLNFSKMYRSKEAPLGYYREFNNKSMFKLNTLNLNIHDKDVYIQDINEEYLNDLDISYNYMNYIVYFITILV